MSVLIDSGSKVFDTEQINVGDVIYAKKNGWTEGVSGIIMYASKERLTVVFHPKIANVMSHFDILASEVQGEEWEELRWSSDLENIVEGYDIYADENESIVTDENSQVLSATGENP